MNLGRVVCLFILSIVQLGRADEATRTVEFIVKAPARTPQNSQLFVTGNIPGLCDWRPACLPLQPIGGWVYSAKAVVPASTTRIEFKISRGSWETEAAGSLGAPYNNSVINLKKSETEVVTNVINWRDLPLGVTGDLRIYENVFSPELGNYRSIRVWLPPDYTAQSGKRYPVIYTHDGQNLFDPQTSSSGVEWEIDERTPEAIIVGIDSNSARMSEYDYAKDGGLYARFLVDTLKPMIDQNFRTLADREHTYTLGSSAGGVISLSLIWKHSDVFSKAAALSLPAHMNNGTVYRIVDSSPVPTLPVDLYLDYGDYGDDADYPPAGEPFVRHLLSIGFPRKTLEHRVFHYADHFESDWARRVEIPLARLLKSDFVTARTALMQ